MAKLSAKSSTRAEAKAWYGRRTELHLQRAKLRAAVLRDAAIVMSTSADPDSVESIEDVVRTLMSSGVYPTFGAMARDLYECAGVAGSFRRTALPSIMPLIKFLQQADQMLGEYPR